MMSHKMVSILGTNEVTAMLHGAEEICIVLDGSSTLAWFSGNLHDRMVPEKKKN
jgi:hypothetical protein